MRCCFQAPQQWCWGTGPQYVLFCFFLLYFFLSDRPSQNQETHSKLNEKKWGGVSKKDCSKVQLIRFHLNGHTAQFCPQFRVLELHTKWIVICESTTWMVTLHGFAVCRFTSYMSLLSKGGVVMRALASHQCCLGSNPGVDAICGLSLLLVLSLDPRGFFLRVSQFSPLLKNQHFQIPIRSGTLGHVSTSS